MDRKFDQAYWSSRYEGRTTGWDAGNITTPIKDYIDQIEDKTLKILIPGTGNGHEFIYLLENGFYNVFALDISSLPLDHIRSQIDDNLHEHLIHENFFDHHGKYDLIIEQTFFCALHPKHRKAYAQKINELLNDNGKLVGLLFNFPLTDQGPPFGGCLEEYQNIFSPYFHIDIMEKSYNSIRPRSGNELFIKLIKK